MICEKRDVLRAPGRGICRARTTGTAQVATAEAMFGGVWCLCGDGRVCGWSVATGG